jgi:hypothetical protein
MKKGKWHKNGGKGKKCWQIAKTFKAKWRAIVKDPKLSKDKKQAALKELKEEWAKAMKAAGCKKCHKKRFFKRHFHKKNANPKCAELKKECKETWKKIEADKSLSKKDKAAKVKALKEGCMKKAKAMHCKKCNCKKNKMMGKHPHHGNMTCKDVWMKAKHMWEQIEHNKNLTKE